MKAMVITSPGGPEVLQLAEVRDPQAGPDEVVLDVEPDTTFLFRLENVLFAPFIPEQQL